MAINPLLANTSRYYSIPDSALTTFPDSDWFVMGAVRIPAVVSTPKYFFSTGAIGDAGAVNIWRQSDIDALGTQVGSAAFFSTATTLATGDQVVYYLTRRSDNLYLGFNKIGGGGSTETAGQAISGVKNGGDLRIGARNDPTLNTARLYTDKMGGAVIVNHTRSCSAEDAAAVAGGMPLLGSDLIDGASLVLPLVRASSTINCLVSSNVATQQGTGWGTDEAFPLNIFPQAINHISIPTSGGGGKQVTLTWQDGAGTLRPSTTGLRINWYDQVDPGLWATPIIQSSTGTSNGSAVVTVDLASSALSVGQDGYLHVVEIDGTDHKDSIVFSGRMTVQNG